MNLTGHQDIINKHKEEASALVREHTHRQELIKKYEEEASSLFSRQISFFEPLHLNQLAYRTICKEILKSDLSHTDSIIVGYLLDLHYYKEQRLLRCCDNLLHKRKCFESAIECLSDPYKEYIESEHFKD